MKEFWFSIDDFLYVTYKTDFPLGSPGSRIIRNTPSSSTDYRVTEAATRYIYKFTQFTLQKIAPTERIAGKHPTTSTPDYIRDADKSLARSD